MNLTKLKISGKYVLCGDIQEISVIQLALHDFANGPVNINQIDEIEFDMIIHAHTIETEIREQIAPHVLEQEPEGENYVD